jgi:hypothetical protein
MGHRISHLALGAVVVATPFGAWTSSALGQTYSITSLTPAPDNVGALVAPSSAVTMTLAASGGALTPSGNVVHQSSAPYAVTVSCADGPGANKKCSAHSMVLKLAAAGTLSQSARFGSLGHFTIANNSQAISSSTIGTTASTYTLGALTNGHTGAFDVGFTFGLLTTGTTGLSTTRTFTVTVGTTNGLGSPSAAYMVATAYHPISIAATSAMAFGAILAPNTGTTTYTLTPSTSAMVSGGTPFKGNTVTAKAAAFSVTGEGAELFQINLPSSFVMTSARGSLTVSTTASYGASGLTSHNFLGSLGTLGSFPFLVGGTLPVSAGTPNGVYTGSLIVSVNYN